MGQKGPETRFFAIFSSLVSLVFLEITYNDSLQQCITSGRGKTHKKVFWGPNFEPKQAEIGSKTRLSAIFSSLVH